MPALIVRDGPSAGQRVELSGEVVLGRAENEFLQHDTEVSRRHAAIRTGPQGLAIEDLGSSNGTFVNDRKIESATTLSSGDVVRVGQTTLEVEIEPAQQATVIRETVAPPVEPAPQEAPPTAPEETTLPQLPQPPVPPPTAPPAYGAPPAPPPAAYAPPPGGYAAGVRPPNVVAAAIILILVGLGSMGYNGWDLSLLLSDLDLLQQVGLGGLAMTLIVIDIVLVVAGLLQLIGGVRVTALSPAGRVLGLVGSAGVILGWLVFLVVTLTEDLALNTLAWAVLVISVAGSVLAGAMLLAAGRSFPSRF